MKRKKLYQKSEKKGLPLWLGTFGDLMSLLLTFFILLLSMATFDHEKVDSAIGSLQGALSVLEHGKETEITQPNRIQATPITHDSPAENVMNVFSSLITEYNEMTKIADGPGINLEESEDGFILRIPNDLLFNTGSSVIENNDGKIFLQRLAMELDSYKDILTLRIIGNTDNVQYKSGSSIDNWDLSNKRALSVADMLLTFGVPADIMEVGGDGEFNPIASNETLQGRAENRRVDINFSFIGNTKDKKQQAKDIINKIQQ
ncbi:motility protein MotB [Helicobacter sp. 16-1353]|uniref:OmpA/MotB family protein n=1 Tax=Helicobacter sp. 16-1353 TaxID=2004996 RepID=UPI000DCB79F5|nr:flagellar motor protein MotB [Helicobacter sp. 16-1353]RAX54900.1 motility protein MotB [Helicobacter sp. 16-1353]